MEYSRRFTVRLVFTLPYPPQSKQTQRINRTLVQMIAAYIRNYYETLHRNLQEIAFTLRTVADDSTKKTLSVLFFGRNILIAFQRFTLVPVTSS